MEKVKNITIVETVSAAGIALLLIIIFIDKVRYMGNHQLTKRLKEAHKYQFSFSQKGWINRVPALE